MKIRRRESRTFPPGFLSFKVAFRIHISFRPILSARAVLAAREIVRFQAGEAQMKVAQHWQEIGKQRYRAEDKVDGCKAEFATLPLADDIKRERSG